MYPATCDLNNFKWQQTYKPFLKVLWKLYKYGSELWKPWHSEAEISYGFKKLNKPNLGFVVFGHLTTYMNLETSVANSVEAHCPPNITIGTNLRTTSWVNNVMKAVLTLLLCNNIQSYLYVLHLYFSISKKCVSVQNKSKVCLHCFFQEILTILTTKK